MGEWLHQWCDAHGRTPLPAEQLSIAQHQQALIDAAAADHNIVVADTTALMTSVYSELLAGDRGLEAYAIAQQRRCDFTLLTALDIVWQPDGLQRDGRQVREPVDDRVRALLIGHGLEGWPRARPRLGSGRRLALGLRQLRRSRMRACAAAAARLTTARLQTIPCIDEFAVALILIEIDDEMARFGPAESLAC